VTIPRDQRAARHVPEVTVELIGTGGYNPRVYSRAELAADLRTLGLTAAISIAGPAWRASRVDPAIALRAK